ncbi:Hsp70 family protein [Chitinimonas sp. BJB300]|uniref:Hsp70 family protein n=1 Tax=Chitinimonas sp. BJB300 TaxID=1559339 RepID=UPI000C0FA897|nr:molecular chaperone HscC [Chitinimonas sp. BJB300]PHV10626.1 molecular chaperone HscC [Chitinimonas sp. BJB300]TSJ87690.1 molecular chaperone HscC [Chitinimonas sp. BJB300]
MILGIDLGTTNSLAAVWQGGRAVMIPNALGHTLTPSVVGLDDQGEVLVGQAARERLLTHPQLTASVFKRYMGSNRTERLGHQLFRAEELSALVLKSLKVDAERFLGCAVEEAVITVPAYFSDAQRKATKIAGQLAGLNVERLVNEPTAAALAYGLHQSNPESRFLVFDLGGGTFDISILELFEGVMEVRASAGDNFLGGEDFSELLIDGFIESAGKAKGLVDKQSDPNLYQALRKQAEQAKRALSNASATTMEVLYAGELLRWEISEAEFLARCEPLLKRLREPIERALRDARLKAIDLDQIVLAGGATRKPIIRKLVAKLFGRLPAMNINPDEVVAQGAAVMAGLKVRDVTLNEVVMTDVCPYTLGIEVSEQTAPGRFQPGFYLPIIERNSVVPISREQSVNTVVDNQVALHVRVFQGESRLVKDNIFLGEITLPVPPKPAGQMAVAVRFTYDVNGLLEAEMTVEATNEKHRLVIEENPGVLTPEQVEEKLQALSKLKIHPRELLPNVTLLARLDRMYQQLLGEERQWVAQAGAQFQALLEQQDEGAIVTGREELKRLLDQVEGEGWL